MPQQAGFATGYILPCFYQSAEVEPLAEKLLAVVQQFPRDLDQLVIHVNDQVLCLGVLECLLNTGCKEFFSKRLPDVPQLGKDVVREVSIAIAMVQRVHHLITAVSQSVDGDGDLFVLSNGGNLTGLVFKGTDFKPVVFPGNLEFQDLSGNLFLLSALVLGGADSEVPPSERYLHPAK